jgi:flagellar biosynthesis GTPase FlhF
MAVKDLAIFRLFGSVFKKGEKEEEREPDAVLGTAKKITESTEEKAESEDAPKQQDIISKDEEKHDEPKAAKKHTKSLETKSDEQEKEPVKKSSAKKTKSTEKSAAKKSSTKKAAAKTTSKKEPAGSKKAAKIKLYTEDIKKHLGSVDDEFLAIVVKNLGPSIYRRDAELVSCSDPKELDTVRKNFLIKKLGFDKGEQEMLDSEIQKVCETLKGVRIKYRAPFYYMLAKNLNKESALS